MIAWGAASSVGGAALLALALAACDGSKPLLKPEPGATPGPFPAADRPIARIVSPRWSNEEARDRLNEAGRVMDLADIRPGMTVADLGAGEGYYTTRLAARVGKDGRVLAEDIVPAVRDALAERVARERLENVSGWGCPPIRGCPPTASTGSSWCTCTTRSRSRMNSCGGCARRCARGGWW